MTTPDLIRWARVRDATQAALELPVRDRHALLLREAGGDEELLSDMQRLMRDCERASNLPDFLPEPDGVACAALRAALFEDYDVRREVGRGGMAAVFLAHDRRHGRPVAVKVLLPGLRDALDADRFLAEIRVMARLNHPHIVPLHASGSTGGFLYYVMPFVEGRTLRQRLNEEAALPIRVVERLLREVASALDYAHRQGVVHRDIKPENILFQDGHAVVADFGIALAVSRARDAWQGCAHDEFRTNPGITLGTPAYMAPEQSEPGRIVDYHADLYALGVVAWEALAGAHPFAGRKRKALLDAHRSEAPACVAERRTDTPPFLADMVGRMLEKDPAARLPSARALQDILERRRPAGNASRHPAKRTDHRRRALRDWCASRWQQVGVAAVGLTAIAAAVADRPGRTFPRDSLMQAGTAVPMPVHRGSIAILPFGEGPANESLDGRQYLTEGIAEGIAGELTRGLSATPGIRIANRASVRILTDSGAGLEELGRRLGVASVLKWALERHEHVGTVTAQLIRTSDARELWSHVSERPLEELGAIPEDIRSGVVDALGYGQADSARWRGATRDLTAYDLYFRGRFAYSKWTPAGLDEAASLFRQAIARDSSFALAYTWLASLSLGTWSGASSDRLHGIKPLVARALELDSTLANAHRIAGYVAMWQDRDWAAAERHLELALALDSSDIWLYHTYASFLAATGRADSAVAVARRALALDPVSSTSATQVGMFLFFQRQYAEAIAVLERAMEVDTIWWKKMPMQLGRAYLAMGRYDDAIRHLRRAGVETAHGLEAPALLAYALGMAGHIEEARALGAQYVERARGSSARPLDLVAVHMGVGDTARALEWLEQLPGDRGSRFYLLSDPMFDPLRASPRFQRVLEQLGLGEAAVRASRSPAHAK